MLATLFGAWPCAAQEGRPYVGLAGETAVEVPRHEVAVEVDGVLDEDVWAGAARLTGFSQYSPQDGVAAADSTEILVWYSHEAIHFGVRAYAAAASVRATLADRDRIDNDDQIQILLDTFADARRALVFGVNPLGIQMDGIRVEGEASRSGFATEAEIHPLDRNPDFVFESSGHLEPWGYQVEVRIPFKSLRYRPDEVQSWGINVVRIVQARGHSQTWTPARRGRASFLAQGGSLERLTGFERGLVLDLNPFVTARADGSQDASGDWGYDRAGPEFGGSVRWGVTENLTLNGTINPDFSQVEADAEQITYDPRQAIAFPEARPFFLEGSERFRVPNSLIYTRRVVRPEVAAKLSGKLSSADLGALFAVDDRAASAHGDRPIVGIVRLTQDVGAASTVGLVYTDRTDGNDYNRVGGLDARLVRGAYTMALQGALSGNRDAFVDGTGHLWDVQLGRAGRRFGFDTRFRGTSTDFVAGSGFLSRTGTVLLQATPRFTWPGDPGDRLESYSLAFNFSGGWLHDAFWDGADPEDVKFHINNSWSLRGGWQLGASLLIERFWYLPYLYTDYAIQHPVAPGVADTVAYSGTPWLDNLDLVVSVTTPTWSTFGGNVMVVVGRDENFDEWAPANILIMSGGLDWRPTDRVRVSPTYSRQQYIRPGDGSTVRVRDLPRVKVEYQLSRAVFVRFVGQYDAVWRDALRDDSRTGDPILIRDPTTGVFGPALETSRNRMQADVLFSYQPSPGTVVFAGYGSAMSEADAFRFRDVQRSGDGFFVKLSWLFRR
ncbi:MAG: carbohydrate binding family 9 domain-containing protein [Gemmatimonadetes bacterium]|nr:carbohydrate binding family 9 domain-containing protein [Gemmatimonadota bacterium]